MVPRKVGTAWEVLAPAKLNLYLEVLGKRTDGFHELETLMVPVRIYDQIRWTPTSSGQDSPDCWLSIEDCTSASNASADNENLVLKAAKLIAAKAAIQPHGHFHLTKRIPMQAGMGGGSSDAAATLLLANECWGLGFSRPELTQLATALGSDVPFFLSSGPAICRGRGEAIEPVQTLPQLHVVVVKPKFGLSTPTVFRELNELEPISSTRRRSSTTQLSRLVEELVSGTLDRACHWMTNRLEEAATGMAPEIQRIKSALAKAGCRGQLMTGSGSTVVGIARTAIQARRIARTLSAQKYGTVLATTSGW